MMFASNKSILSVAVFSVLAFYSCQSDYDEELGDEGFRLVFIHRPSEVMKVFNLDETDENSFGVLVSVTSTLKEHIGDTKPRVYSIDGDQTIERQVKEFLDPDHTEFVGSIPVPIEYRTEVCKTLRILLIDENEDSVEDITSFARFHHVDGPIDWLDVGGGLIVNSNKVLLGRIPIGTTIEDYLAYRPMVFASAHFIISGVNKDNFIHDCYVRIEIELDNGKILTTDKKLRGPTG